MVITHEDTQVSAERLKLHLLKVSYPGGYHLVAGGRLIREKDGTVVTSHPDMPEYTPDSFPVPLDGWTNDEYKNVSVQIVTRTGYRPVNVVRACTLLFTPRNPKAVAAWIRETSEAWNRSPSCR